MQYILFPYEQQKITLSSTLNTQTNSQQFLSKISEFVWEMWSLEYKRRFFFLKKIGGHKSFLWGHWYSCFGLLVTSHLAFKARVGSLIPTWQRHTCNTFLKFTSGAIPANLLEASMAVKLISSTYLWPGTGGTQTGNLSCHRRTLYRLSCADVFTISLNQDYKANFATT